MSPILLIAEREFRTYVATLSFWLSLAIAPLAAGAALFLSGIQAPPALVTVKGGDNAYQQSAHQALEEAGRLEGKSLVFAPGGASLVLSRKSSQHWEVRFGADFPLSPVGRAMVGHMIERDAARRDLRQEPLVISEYDTIAAGGVDAGVASRMIALVMLWLTLAGSLGMLLQAVVRERANRALESLLGAARPWQIVSGKMLGVGAVSLLVLAAWGVTAALFSLFAGRSAPFSTIMGGISDAATLARDAAIYICAFLFYGAMTVALGAMARDSASAQNAARPMFLLLLAVFLVALSAFTNHSSAMSWLAWIPPLTPFLLLTDPPRNVALATQALQLGILLFASWGMSVLASLLISVVPERLNILGKWR
jgi:ABC-2 type transport system permease protein